MIPQVQSWSYCSYSIAAHRHYFLSPPSHTHTPCFVSVPCYAIDGILEMPRAFLATFLWVTVITQLRLGSFLFLLELGLWRYVWVVAESVSLPALLPMPPGWFSCLLQEASLPFSCPLGHSRFCMPPLTSSLMYAWPCRLWGGGYQGLKENKPKDSCTEKLGLDEPCELVERHQQPKY